ncbi:hypothetical protein V8E54_015176 [Elaphomyces granulatus]
MYIQGNPEYPGLLWNALQSILERANFDRLFLFDCCYAAALTKGSNEYTMEFLTSSRREVISQGPKWSPYVGSPFTQTLIKYLKQGVQLPNIGHTRLGVKKSRHGVVSLEEIFYWCMAVDGYKVREDNVDCVHDDDVQLIWEFVDTTRTSSTLQCGDMLSTIAGNRSGDGFRRSCVIKRVTNDKPRQAGFSVTELQSLG